MCYMLHIRRHTHTCYCILYYTIPYTICYVLYFILYDIQVKKGQSATFALRSINRKIVLKRPMFRKGWLGLAYSMLYKRMLLLRTSAVALSVHL